MQMGFTQARELVRDKHEYYQALMRNGWFMPAYKGQFLNSDVLIKIRDGRMYCPKFADLVPRPCPCPPDAQTLKNELNNGIEHHLTTMDQSLKPRFQELQR
jgi:hypothetical protein